jgi:hypothetical protein
MSYRFPVINKDVCIEFLQFLYEADVITYIRWSDLYDWVNSGNVGLKYDAMQVLAGIRDSNPDVYKVFEVRHKLLGS